MNLKQLLAVLLSVALVNPAPMSAASVETVSPPSTLGSITVNGSVQVREIQVPTMSTLFSGDRVQTGQGNAIVQYKEGPRVLLGSESAANFSTSEVQLQKGQMTFETSGKPVIFAASTLRLEPAAGKSAANVTVQDKTASVSVSEGSVRVMDPSGTKLADLKAGDARLFEKVAAPPPPPAAAPAAAPQMGGGGGAWLVALAAGIVGTSLGIAALVRANNAEDAADDAQATAEAAQSQVAAIQSTNAALQTQVNSLNSQLVSLNAFATAQKASNAELIKLEAAQAQVNQIQRDLETVQQDIDRLQTELISGGSSASQAVTPTPQQLSLLLDLLGRQRGLVIALQAAVNAANQARLALQARLSGALP
ncbi:MAG: hypothetical protein HY313_06575 [Acidobacteria bacterium]|nr:hypothetical protein [Acidobacteriota bacterium]